MTPGDESRLEEEEEKEDSSDQEEGTINEESAFSFIVPRQPVTTPKSKTLRKSPITPTKISGDSNFLKRSINDLSFTPEPLTRRNPRITQGDENTILRQILSKLDMLSQTVKSQSAHILTLEKQLEEFTTHSKGDIQADKANRATTKKIEIMADRVAALAATTISSTGGSKASKAQSNAVSGPDLKVSNSKKTSPALSYEFSQQKAFKKHSNTSSVVTQEH